VNTVAAPDPFTAVTVITNSHPFVSLPTAGHGVEAHSAPVPIANIASVAKENLIIPPQNSSLLNVSALPPARPKNAFVRRSRGAVLSLKSGLVQVRIHSLQLLSQ